MKEEELNEHNANEVKDCFVHLHLAFGFVFIFIYIVISCLYWLNVRTMAMFALRQISMRAHITYVHIV